MLLLCSCATLRQSAIDVSIEEVKNAKAAREVALNYLTVWPIQSGFIRGALGPRIDELPTYAIDAMNGLDELSAADPNDIGDYELGTSLGLRVRLLGAVIREALRFYAPDILKFVPLFF